MFDPDGILGQRESDGNFGGGDSLSWHGGFTLLGGEKRNFYKLFGKGNGGLARHPSEGRSAYYGSPWDGRVSRDQLTGALAAILSQGDIYSLWKVFLHHGAWLWLFSYNTKGIEQDVKWKLPDITGPDIWGMYLRGFMGRWCYLLLPIVLFCDFFLLLGAISLRINNDSHVISYLHKLISAHQIAPSPITSLCFAILSDDFIEDNLARYWCDWRDNCFMVKLYMKAIRKIRSQQPGL